jgi:hypothetical protein
VFEQHREKKAAKQHQEALDRWKVQRDEYADLLQTARTFNGIGASGLILGPSEAVFCQVTGASLIEERRGAGHYQGRSRSVSIPIGLGVRYRTGGSRGHYVQGTPAPTAIDTGTVYITNRRVIFQGARQTRECAFAKLIGFQHSDSEGSTTFSVSNRQKPTTIHYGPSLSASFDFRLDLALAHYNGTVSRLVQQLHSELAAIEASRPMPGPPGPPAVSGAPEVTSARAAAGRWLGPARSVAFNGDSLRFSIRDPDRHLSAEFTVPGPVPDELTSMADGDVVQVLMNAAGQDVEVDIVRKADGSPPKPAGATDQAPDTRGPRTDGPAEVTADPDRHAAKVQPPAWPQIQADGPGRPWQRDWARWILILALPTFIAGLVIFATLGSVGEAVGVVLIEVTLLLAVPAALITLLVRWLRNRHKPRTLSSASESGEEPPPLQAPPGYR